MSRSLRECYDRLTDDPSRQSQFSSDMVTTSSALLYPHMTDFERKVVMDTWLGSSKGQPCLFGRIAAKADGIEYCFIEDRDFLESDERVRKKIADARRLWKQRAFRGVPVSGFMLVVLSLKVMTAVADAALQEFATRVQELVEWSSTIDPEGDGND